MYCSNCGKRISKCYTVKESPSSANPQAFPFLFQFCILGALAGLINISGGNHDWENYVAIISPLIIGYSLWPTLKEKNPSVK